MGPDLSPLNQHLCHIQTEFLQSRLGAYLYAVLPYRQFIVTTSHSFCSMKLNR